MLQGGDFTACNGKMDKLKSPPSFSKPSCIQDIDLDDFVTGSGGESIYNGGGPFPDENFIRDHDRPGTVFPKYTLYAV